VQWTLSIRNQSPTIFLEVNAHIAAARKRRDAFFGAIVVPTL